MRFKKPREEELRLGIAPLIDIVFLLLIFFMLTSHFDVASGIHIRLPKVVQKAYTTQDSKITLLVDSEGRTLLEGEELDVDTLASRLEALVKEKDVLDLIIHADTEVRHGRVVELMDLAKTAGIRSIIIAARWDPQKVL
jgi:biopolymer transport protein ExbD